MVRIALATLALCLAAIAAPVSALTYPASGAPVAGNCDEVASRVGAAATWYGEFSGRYYDTFRDMSFPYADRGCFESEYACRRWQNQSMTYTGQGGILYTRCTRGIRDGD